MIDKSAIILSLMKLGDFKSHCVPFSYKSNILETRQNCISLQAGAVLQAEGQQQTSFNRLSFRSRHTMTVEGSTVAALTEALTCVPERGKRGLQEDATEIAVVRLFVRWEASGSCQLWNAELSDNPLYSVCQDYKLQVLDTRENRLVCKV